MRPYFYVHFLSLFISMISMACIQDPLMGKDLKTGKPLTFSPASAKKGTVVLFLSAKCPCSKSHEQTLATLSKKHPTFQFIGIHSNADEPEALAKNHFEKSPFSFPVLQDDGAILADKFGAFKTPHAFIVGPKGECWFDGGVDNSKEAPQADEFYLASALEQLEKGQEPKDKKVRTLGCIIKR
jgi:hypothetical protein